MCAIAVRPLEPVSLSSCFFRTFSVRLYVEFSEYAVAADF
jgi:hypothetical protein